MALMPLHFRLARLLTSIGLSLSFVLAIPSVALAQPFLALDDRIDDAERRWRLFGR